ACGAPGRVVGGRYRSEASPKAGTTTATLRLMTATAYELRPATDAHFEFMRDAKARRTVALHRSTVGPWDRRQQESIFRVQFDPTCASAFVRRARRTPRLHALRSTGIGLLTGTLRQGDGGPPRLQAKAEGLRHRCRGLAQAGHCD